MSRARWFLPETPDVLGLLRAQVAVTIEGVDAFARWAGGDASAAAVVRDAEHVGTPPSARSWARCARRS